MIRFDGVGLRRGARELFSEASFTLHRGDRVGIVGRNGCGKSSLLACLLGQLPPDSGELYLPPGLTLAHVAQEIVALERTALDFVLDGDGGLRALEARIAQAAQQGEGTALAALHARYEEIGGYRATARAARLLTGLGFDTEQLQQPVATFSGGWRVRLALAQALMCRSDVLLLDEPTNHLDLDAVLWLQDWLLNYPGTLLFISHDRDFLDTLATRILRIAQRRAELYNGNYSEVERQWAARFAEQQAAYAKQQRQIAHVQRYIDRFRAQATKARQAQSRIKTLQRMQLIAAAHADSPFSFAIREPDKLPAPLWQCEDLALGYGERAVLQRVTLSLAPGDRFGLLGSNGAGKSTLIKALAGQLAPRAGTLRQAEGLRIGYFAQHQLEQLQLEYSALWHLQQLDPKAPERDLRGFLGGFDFSGEQALAPVAGFSGGEKARLVLALLAYQAPNLLLLDEPTNHLDLEMRDALAAALQDYPGAIVVVSHDRYLLNAVADRFLLVADGGVQSFDGDLADYRQWLAARRQAAFGDDEQNTSRAPSRKTQRQREAEKRRQLKPLQDAMQRAEAQLAALHARQHALEQQLADPELYQDTAKARLLALLAEKNAVDDAVAGAELAWLEASEQWERAASAQDV